MFKMYIVQNHEEPDFILDVDGYVMRDGAFTTSLIPTLTLAEELAGRMGVGYYARPVGVVQVNMDNTVYLTRVV